MNPTQKPISIIVPVYNNAELTYKSLGLNLLHCAMPQQWIIIDNNSNEQTKEILRQFKAMAEAKNHFVHIETEAENTGVARAWNKGLSLCKNDSYKLILNNDCVMQPFWDTALMQEDAKEVLHLFSPLVFEPQFFKKPFSLEAFLENEKWKQLAEKNKDRYFKGFFSGIVIFGKNEVFQKIGMFDEQFWLSLEDIDFEHRARQEGYSIGLTGNVTAFHYVSATRKNINASEESNKERFRLKTGWDYTLEENKFLNKRKRSYRKWLMRNFELISQWPEKFPV